MGNYLIDTEKFRTLSYKLLDEIKQNGHTYQAVLCPLRGGFYLSYFMSKHLKLPMRYLEISSYTGQKQGEFFIGLKPDLSQGKFLLCDDIFDSGNTIRKILEIYEGIDFDVAFLLSKSPEPHDNYYIGEYIDKNLWVDFYWEIM
ncbi:MAG: hypothetical protein JW982_11260 [Spirochaetes bacterium]|nr:hypothetical protein [Spirochaetota bacterium]